MAAGTETEMSKTYQYRKVMKPMLERKRRARINKCLDELKDLMIATLESEGEHVTRLEKADILELTVNHLQKLKEQKRLNGGTTALSQAEGFRTGYIYAANEVSRTLSQIPGVNVSLGTQLMTHLGQRLNQIQPTPAMKLPLSTSIISLQSGYLSPSPSSVYSSSMPPLSPMSSSRSSYTESPQPDAYKQTEFSYNHVMSENRCNHNEDDAVWRPW